MIEQSILSNLVYNEEYTRKALPFLKDEYFTDHGQKTVFRLIKDYIDQYNGLPTKEALTIEANGLSNMNESAYKAVTSTIGELKKEETGIDFLIDSTEKFCQDKALYLAVSKAIQVMDGSNKDLGKGAIPDILKDALAVTFDTSVGHDYLEDAESRFEFYHRKEERVPFDLKYLNEITKGGLPKKTLNIVLAGTGVGKSLFMCHCAASNLTLGKNVLYITMEMAEERISERIDANLLNVTVQELAELPRDAYMKKVQKLREKTVGKLIVKEYPTASASTHHFRALLNELNLKRGFVPDIIYIDYLNICTSSRIKMGSQVNSYTLIKSIAEEMRGLAGEFKVPIVSATQTTRSGYSSSDLDLTDTSESFGLPATADFMIGLSVDEDMESRHQMMVKQLKNRYNDPSKYKRFIIGMDRAKMRLYDAEDEAQDNLLEGPVAKKPVFDNTDVGEAMAKSNAQSLRDKLKLLV